MAENEQNDVLGCSYSFVFSTHEGVASTAQVGSETFEGTIDECVAWMEERGVK